MQVLNLIKLRHPHIIRVQEVFLSSTHVSVLAAAITTGQMQCRASLLPTTLCYPARITHTVSSHNMLRHSQILHFRSILSWTTPIAVLCLTTYELEAG